MRDKNIFQMMTMAGLLLFASTIPISFVPGEFGVALAVVGWVGDGVIRKNWRLEWNPVFLPVSIYLAWNILSAAVSVRPVHSLLAVGDNEWPVLLMIMMFWTIEQESDLERVVRVFLIVSGVAMAYAVWQTFGGLELYRSMALTPMEGFYRNVGFYSFYLTFAAFAMTVFFLSTGLMLEEQGTRRRWYALVAILSLAAVVGSFARSIWLALAVAAPLLGFTRGRKFGLITIGSLALLTVVLMLSVPAFQDRILSILDLSQNQTRLNLWKTSFAIFADKPLLGTGQDNFDYFFPLFKVPGYYDTTTHPHNDYLNVLISSGLPGLLSYLWIWGVTLWTGFRTWKTAASPLLRGASLGASLGLVGFLIGSLFQDYYGTFANCLGWWFVVGIVFASFGLAKKAELQGKTA